jgi:Ran GTPase-activating protein (RanGAP) involved in mRNA processing and transport
MRYNKGLTELDIEANSLTPKAATVLANSLSFNESLLKLNINGNVLGKTGAQALVVGITRDGQ